MVGRALPALAAAAAVSLAFPAYHFVVLAHLHNVVPLFYLWEWSARMPVRARRGFRTANLVWVIGIPALILAGAFDGLLRAAPAGFGGADQASNFGGADQASNFGGADQASNFGGADQASNFGGLGGLAAFESGRLAASYAPPAFAAGMGVRFLAVFAFMQTMHYVVWVGVLPRYAPEAAARFEARVPALRGGRAWLLGGGLAVLLGIVFALDYAQGRTLYAAGATYHAYLEFPVLLALVLTYRAYRQGASR